MIDIFSVFGDQFGCPKQMVLLERAPATVFHAEPMPNSSELRAHGAVDFRWAEAAGNSAARPSIRTLLTSL